MKALFVLLFVLVLANAKKLTNKERKEILYQANNQRAQLAIPTKYKDENEQTNTPPAANMYKLTYSKKLEKKALKMAKTCNTNLSLGYTFFVRDINDVDDDEPPPSYSTFIPNAVFLWATMFAEYQTTYFDKSGAVTHQQQPLVWNETSKYSLPNATKAREAYGTEFGQFMWAKASQIGCAQQYCSAITGRWRDKLLELNIAFNSTTYPFVVCAYKKKAVYGQNVYKKGKKMKCPKGTKGKQAIPMVQNQRKESYPQIRY
ncbi:hypothetical protein M3Y97_00949100 [Aphelenchoides bicaudatus]|nr:hypothetical protein M3Y97_00949100 [Aphelenchoides bicaudatus]